MYNIFKLCLFIPYFQDWLPNWIDMTTFFFLNTCQPFYGRYKFHWTPKTSDGRAGPTYWLRSHSLRPLSSCTEDFNKASARKVLLRSLPHISCPMQGDNPTIFTVPSSRWTVRSRLGPAIGRISKGPGPLSSSCRFTGMFQLYSPECLFTHSNLNIHVNMVTIHIAKCVSYVIRWFPVQTKTRRPALVVKSELNRQSVSSDYHLQLRWFGGVQEIQVWPPKCHKECWEARTGTQVSPITGTRTPGTCGLE